MEETRDFSKILQECIQEMQKKGFKLPYDNINTELILFNNTNNVIASCKRIRELHKGTSFFIEYNRDFTDLPTKLIKDSIYHELIHTLYFNHGKEFADMAREVNNKIGCNVVTAKTGLVWDITKRHFGKREILVDYSILSQITTKTGKVSITNLTKLMKQYTKSSNYIGLKKLATILNMVGNGREGLNEIFNKMDIRVLKNFAECARKVI